jgi:hypothetical protein
VIRVIQTERRQVRTEREQLLTLINQWDPAGLIQSGAPRDAYERLVDPLYDLLAQQTAEADIAALLDRELREHFGVTPQGTPRFAAKVLAWSGMRSHEA